MSTLPIPTSDAVLILDADGRAGLACVQSLGPAGVTVHAAIRFAGSLTEASRWCDRVHLQPQAEPLSSGVRWLKRLDERFHFKLILPTTEASLRWLRLLPEDDPTRAKAILPSDAALDTALDKEATAAAARRLGLPIPESRLLPKGSLAPPAEGFPRVLKPVHSKVVVQGRLMTLAVSMVRTDASRNATLDDWLRYTAVQEQVWVPGRGIGVEVLYDRGRMLWHFVHDRLHESPLTGGASVLRRASGAEQELVALSCRLLDDLNWHGVAMVEWRRDEAGLLHLMEINPRLWGSLPLTIAAGVDVPRGLLSLARGETLQPNAGWKVGLRARNLTGDVKWLIENARADQTDGMLLTRPVIASMIDFCRGMVSREAWDGWNFRDPAVAWRELTSLLRWPYARAIFEASRRIGLWQARRRHRRRFGQDSPSAWPIESVLFLCLGNVCRSPFAAQVAIRCMPGLRVESAGFHEVSGRASPMNIVESARGMGFDLSGCSSLHVNADQLDRADLILVMDLSNLRRLAAEHPDAMARTTLLGLFCAEGPVELLDPYDLMPVATRQIMGQVLSAVEALSDWLLRRKPIPGPSKPVEPSRAC